MTAALIILFLLLPYVGLMLIFAAGFRRQTRVQSQAPESGNAPAVTVVIAARNEAENITGLLTSLNQQKTPPEKLEIILVDDHSEDDTATIAERFGMACSFSVIRSADAGFSHGKKGALDGGIRRARHPVIAVTDADAQPPDSWTETIRAAFSDPDCVFAAGLVKYYAGSGFLHALETLDFYGLVASGAGAAGIGYPFICNAANMAFRNRAYQEVEGMTSHAHRSSGDDVLLLHKMIARFGRKRIRWYCAPEGITATHPAGAFHLYFKQRVRWASKGGDYRNPTAIMTAIIVLLTNTLLVAVPIIALLQSLQACIPLALFALKGITDLPLLIMITRRFDQIKLLRWFIPTTIVYPAITLSAGIASFFWKPGWKGREIR